MYGPVIGIALTLASADAATLLQNADSAAALAKREATPFVWYEPKEDSARSSRLALIADLHDALERISFFFGFSAQDRLQ